MMLPVYRGFDGLDVSFRAQIGEEFCAALKSAKEQAQKSNRDACLNYAGNALLVAATGARGGYAYRASTGKIGATWFFKDPNFRDPWGIRVSCNSFMLADQGLGWARSEIYRCMERWGIHLEPRSESIGRVDYAVDILAPHFVLEPDHFVMHSNTNRANFIGAEPVSINGKSARVTSVTVGKMPGRQIIVYDKRAEVIAKHKWAWFDIWNASCVRAGWPELKCEDPSLSRTWRAEIRAGKQHLKDRWNIRTWADLDARFGDLVNAATVSVRLTEPVADKNRSRRPNSLFWNLVRAQLQEDLFEMRNFCPPDTIKRVQKKSHLQMLKQQSVGLLLTRAAIAGISTSQLADFAKGDAKDLESDIASRPQAFEDRLSERMMRYDVFF